MILTLDQARAQCAYWQRLLRLQDWDIEVSIVRQEKLNGVGACTIGTSRRAEIFLLDPVDFIEKEHPRCRDMEDTLVHELLHIHLHDCRIRMAQSGEPKSAEEVAAERAIEAMTSALLTLSRDAAGESTV